MRRAFWLLALFLSLSLAQPMWVGVATISGGQVTVTANVTGESPLEISIPSGARVIGANYSNGTAVFNGSFSYSYTASGMVADSQGGKLFLFAFSQPEAFNYSFSVTLPAGGTISSTVPKAVYFTDGRLIGAEWKGTTSQKQFTINYHIPEGSAIQLIHTDIPLVDKTIFLPGIILAFLLGYFLAAGTATALLQRIRHITANMSEDEKSIVYLIRNGPMEQSKIQRKLNFSKAKLSRTLRSMEERKIIEKTPKGKTNLISLK